MIVQLTGVNLEAKLKDKWDGIEITYQPEAYNGRTKDPVTRFIFGNSDFAKVAKTLVVGDWIEMTFDNTQYKNIDSMEKVASPPKQEAPPSSPSRSKPYSGRGEDDDVQGRIARSVAIKEGVNIVGVMASAGGYTSANMKKLDFVVRQVLLAAKDFEDYVSNGAKSDGEVEGEVGGGEEVNQEVMG